MSFESLGLRAELLRAVSENGYSIPTPIQQQAIPIILEGRDLMGGAQTGTGKTAGFTLPLLQRLMSSETGGNGRRAISWCCAVYRRGAIGRYGKFTYSGVGCN